MSFTKDLSIPYHQQETDYYCGAACAQMVLEEIGAGVFDETSLYNDNHNHSSIEGGWYTAPDGLLWTLNNRRPAGFGSFFSLFALATGDAASRKVVWTIYHSQVGAVALVFGWQHWLVVRGFEASTAPSGSDDASYQIVSLSLNNPWFGEPVDEHITYYEWLSTYMTGVPQGHWQNQFVVIGDSDPAPTQIGQPPRAGGGLSGDRLMHPAQCVAHAAEAIAAHGLYNKDSWSRNLATSAPGEPYLVQRLDRQDSFYYIVPWRRAGEAPTVLARVNARFGHYQHALSEHGTNPLAKLSFDSTTILEQVKRERVDFGDGSGLLVIRDEACSVYPTLVWKPCRESLSPFLPFHMVIVGDRRIYVRVDGRIFTELHDQDRG